MFIGWGKKVCVRDLVQGQFCCPSCNVDNCYILKQARKFFVIYDIPLIPLNVMAHYLECQGCQAWFKPSLLSGTTELDEITESLWDSMRRFFK